MRQQAPTFVWPPSPLEAPPAGNIGSQTDTDDFERAFLDPVTGNWTTQAATPRLYLDGAGHISYYTSGDCDAFWNAWAYNDDQYSQAVLSFLTGSTANSGFGVTVRRNTTIGTKTYYRLVMNGTGAMELSRFNAGTKTQLTTGSVTYVAGKQIGLRILGSTLQIWYDGVQIGSDYVDSSPLSGGCPGLVYGVGTSDSGQWDSWDAGTTGVRIGTKTLSDDFTRANENPIATNWTDSTVAGHIDMILFNNHVEPAGFGAGDGECFRTSWAGGDDQYSQAKITVVGNNAAAHAGLGVEVRRSTTAGTNTSYRAVIDDAGTIFLHKAVTGTGTNITTRSVTYVAGTRLGLSVSGTTLKIWYGGVQQGADVTDSDVTSGSPGLAYSSNITGGSIDNWDAGTVP
jgi:hypothetical protein